MKSNLLKDFLSYGAVGVLAKFVGFFTIPIYARFLSQSDFGVLEILSVFMAILPYITTFQLESSLLRLFFEKKINLDKKKLFSTGLFGIIPVSIILSLFLIGFSEFFSELLLKSDTYSLIFIIVVSELVFKNIIGYCTVIYRVEFNRKIYTQFNLSYVILNAFLGILTVVVFNYGIMGLLISRLAVSIIYSIIAFTSTRKYFTLYFSIQQIKEMLTYGLPLLPEVFARWGQKYLSRIFIVIFFSLEQMGVFAITAKVLLPLILLTGSLKMAWHPYSFDHFEEKGSSDLFNDFFNLFSLIGTLIVVFLIFFGKDLLVLFASDKFISGGELIGVLAIAFILNGMSDLISSGILIRKKNMLLAYASIVSVCVGCFSMYFLAIQIGLLGIVLGELIGELVKYGLTVYFVREHFSNYFKFRRITIGLVFLLVIIFSTNYGVISTDINISLKILLYIALLILFCVLYFYKNTSLSNRIVTFLIR